MSDVRRLFEEGQSAWPGLDVSPEAFAAHLAACGAAGEAFAGVRAADLYLACACAARARGALEAFERAHVSQVGAFLAGMRPPAAFVDEVQQVLREKLFVGRAGASPKIAEYTGRGALASWVRVIALRAAIDLRRQGGAMADEGEGEREDPATADPEREYLKQRYRQAFHGAIRGALAALDRESKELLRLHFVGKLTLDQLAERSGVHRATIARRLAAAREEVAGEARRRLGAALGASDAELESLVRVMRSQLDVTLQGLLS